MGLAMVRRFQKDGFRVAACATTLEGAQKSGADFAFACDVSKRDSVRSGIASVVKALGRIDIGFGEDGDAAADRREAVVSDAMARRFWPGSRIVGRE